MVSLSTSSFCNITNTCLDFSLLYFGVLFMEYAFLCVIRFSVPAHQLYIVDASLFELLQSSFGLFLQWECKTLESLCTLVQAKLHGDLRDIRVDGKTGKGQYGKSKMPPNLVFPHPCSCSWSPKSSTILLGTPEKVQKRVSNKRTHS